MLLKNWSKNNNGFRFGFKRYISSIYNGKMKINIMNYERERDENGNIIPVASENENSLVVKVSAYGKNALLTGDIDPTDGATKKLPIN